MSFVTCKLFAQAGNQAFMIAATIAHALKHGVEYKIPRQGHSPELPAMPWPHLPEWTPSDGLGSPYVEPPGQFGLYHDMPYWPKMRLQGYFQNENYFKDYRKEILEAFAMPYSLLKDIVSIHVRRTDYLIHPTKYTVVGHDYYSQAIKIFTDKGYCNFKIFSDDIEWAKEYFPTAYRELNFEFIDRNTNPVVNMAYMSSCEHNIICASTYSWWAAWMNQNNDKIIVAPETWFGPGNNHLNSSQIVPASWIRV